MGNLKEKEKKFYKTNVQGYWKNPILVCSKSLVCSKYLYVGRKKEN